MSKILITICCCFCLGAWAQGTDTRVHAVASDPTWLGLLQVHEGVRTGADDFYVSPEGQTPAQELAQSLAAVQDPAQSATFACRFPARYWFITHRFGLPGAKEQLRRCERLTTAIEIDRIEGLSLVLVGSYLSNPASSFGHTLLRLHQTSDQGIERDLSFNYGAVIPQNENVVAYIAKGVFGWYAAAFSDQEPFVHDITYNHLENRDSWSYAIEHDNDDRLLIALHLWEMAGAKFTYYFFSRNCAWQMANALRLTLAEANGPAPSVPWWTLPVDVVHELQDQGKVRAVTHTASHQRQLNAALERLNPIDAVRFMELIQSGAAVDAQRDSTALINAVVDYYTWRNASNALEADEERRLAGLREQAVLARLQLPPEARPLVPEPQPSPADGNKPIKFSLGYQDRPTASWSVYSQGPLDPHALGVGHIRALVFEVSRPTQGWRLDAFTFLDIERIQSSDAFELNGFSPSWRIRLDMFREDGLKPRAKGSLGWSHVRDRWSATAYADLTVVPGQTRVDPVLSLLHRGSRTQSQVEMSGEGRRSASLQYQWTKTYFLGASYQKHRQGSVGVSVGAYW
ncbi:DUF4105 domain-containing protein [Limnohabitans sp.]|uniref:lipoprotein N-acyltransferase Lnb domain-containing protein n=1 Tax=Limnohabitans sp. TaxID=1907725 RepID=UPI0031FCF1BC